jgi:hypothetical protein
MLKGACQLAVALSVAVFRTGGNTDLQQSGHTGQQGNVVQCACKAKQSKAKLPVRLFFWEVETGAFGLPLLP